MVHDQLFGLEDLANEDDILDTQEPPLAQYSDLQRSISKLADYGKWQWLSLDHSRLDVESDVASEEPRRVLLVDLPENQNDVFLWSCILNFRYRVYGLDGVSDVLHGLHKRRTLRDVQGEATLIFWETLLKEAVRHEQLLVLVWDYAEWLYASNHVSWPNLYDTTISYLLANNDTAKAVRWHLRLSPHFRPGASAFAQLLRRFMTKPSRSLQQVLKSLYLSSPYRELYDELVPFLYEHGNYSLACQWRNTLLLHDDGPVSPAARPFLRFLAGYLPSSSPLVKSELKVAGLKQKSSDKGVVYEKEESDLWYLLNRVHGETFAIKEKVYNDSVGARWFASSWVPLDLGIDFVRVLGFNAIGPLSIQSIALREGSVEQVHSRLQRLKALGISVGISIYVRAIKYFAAVGEQESLTNLLLCDIHPDVFDDAETMERILEAAITQKDWAKYHVIQAIKVVRLCADREDLDSTAELLSNNLLGKAVIRNDRETILNVLADMTTRGIQVSPSISDALSTDILENVSPHNGPNNISLDFYHALCCDMVSKRFTLATEAFQIILLRLCRAGRLDDLEKLSVGVARRYHSLPSLEGAMWFAHDRDVPELLRGERSSYNHFHRIPSSLRPDSQLHPLRLIFSNKLQQSIIRASFRFSLTNRQREQEDHDGFAPPKDYGFARGVHLLSILEQNGVHISKRSVRNAIIGRLVELFAPTAGTRKSVVLAKLRNQLTLEQAKRLCDDAWGSEILPALPELVEAIEEMAAEREENWFHHVKEKSFQQQRLR